MTSPSINILPDGQEKRFVWTVLAAYVLSSLIWGFASNATWDDDCAGRYYNTLNALQDPKQFLSLWNRPLFVILFALPVHISKYSILIGMVSYSTIGAYALYKALSLRQTQNAWMVIPLFLFQPYYFSVSRNALTEPLAAVIICLGFLFWTQKKYLPFALIGSLLPLARLELSVLLGIWALLLIIRKQWKWLPVLGIPVIIWNFGGFFESGDTLWLADRTVLGDNEENRYGHTTFGSYFQRYIWVVGPIVYFFFLLGFGQQLLKKRINLFVHGQMVVGFMLYVIFSWKLNMGNAAGFLRNLLPLSPLVAIMAVDGINFWNQTLWNTGRSDPEAAIQTKKQREAAPTHPQRVNIIGLGLFMGLLVAITWIFHSNHMVIHHIITEDKNYTHLIIIGSLVVLTGGLLLWSRFKIPGRRWYLVTGMLILLMLPAYTFIAEPPKANMNPERSIMDDVSDAYVRSSMSDHPTYVNHIWFFWANDLNRNEEKFHSLNREELIKAPDSSIVIWENHYSNRLNGDVPAEALINDPGFIELFRLVSSNKKFMSIVFQKIPKNSPNLLSTYSKLIQQNPHIHTLYLSRANIKYNRFQDYVGAIADYDLALKHYSESFDSYYNRGLCYFNLSQYPQAIKDFTAASKIRPDHIPSYLKIGTSRNQMRDYANAIPYFTKVIEMDGQHVKAYFNRATAFSNLNNSRQALNDYLKVIRLDPSYSLAHYNAAVLYLHADRLDLACPAFVKAYELGYQPAKTPMDELCNQGN